MDRLSDGREWRERRSAARVRGKTDRDPVRLQSRDIAGTRAKKLVRGRTMGDPGPSFRQPRALLRLELTETVGAHHVVQPRRRAERREA